MRPFATNGEMGRYPSNNFDAYKPAPCPRCGERPHIDWINDTTYGDPVPVYEPRGRRWCETPGCVDEHGSNQVPTEREAAG